MAHDGIRKKRREIGKKRLAGRKEQPENKRGTNDREAVYLKRIFSECSRRDRLSAKYLPMIAARPVLDTVSDRIQNSGLWFGSRFGSYGSYGNSGGLGGYGLDLI